MVETNAQHLTSANRLLRLEFSAAKAINFGPFIPLSCDVDESPLFWLAEVLVAPLVFNTFGLRFTAINCKSWQKEIMNRLLELSVAIVQVCSEMLPDTILCSLGSSRNRLSLL